jgi:hypothetical protein
MRHENDDIERKLLYIIHYTFNIVYQNYYYSNKTILIFIALNPERTVMLNDM